MSRRDAASSRYVEEDGDENDDDEESPLSTQISKKTQKKTRRNFLFRRFSPLLLFSFLSLSLGLAGICFSGFIFLQRKSVPMFRCRGAEDTTREFRYVKPRRVVSNRDGTERVKLLGVVGVHTGFSSRDRRDALRDTWFPSDSEGLLSLEHSTGLAFRFVIGRTQDAKKMLDLQDEIQKYNDFLLIDIEEDYLRLPYKTLAFFKAAFDLFDAEYYVKADDDIYLRPDRLATLLAKERVHPLTYIGCMKKGPVITDPKMKWYEKSGSLLGSEYFKHAYGPLYALSSEVVKALAHTKKDRLRMFSNEDVTIGAWMLAMNVEYDDNRDMCDTKCTPTTISVWDIPNCSVSGLCDPADRMRELHKISMCSKSPTLLVEDV